MKDELTESAAALSKSKNVSPPGFFIALNSTSFMLVIATVFAIVAGFHFLTFLNHRSPQRVSISRQWSETEVKQLQVMNNTIKEELDLIVAEHRDNQALRAQLTEIKTPDAKPASSVVASTGVIQGNAQ